MWLLSSSLYHAAPTAVQFQAQVHHERTGALSSFDAASAICCPAGRYGMNMLVWGSDDDRVHDIIGFRQLTKGESEKFVKPGRQRH